MTRALLLLVLILLLLAAPHFYFQLRINEAFLASAAEAGLVKNLFRAIKFTTYSMVPASMILALTAVFPKKPATVYISSAVYLVVLLLLTNYYDYFGVVPHWRQISLAGNLFAIGDQIKEQLLGWEDGLTLLSIGTAAHLLKQRKISSKYPKLLKIASAIIGTPALFLLLLQFQRHPPVKTLDTFGHTLGCSHYGILPTYALMLSDFLPREARYVAHPDANSQRRGPTKHFAAAKEANVLCIQLESLDASLIEKQIGNEPLMPFLRSLSRRHVYFTEFVAMHGGGGSSDAELSSLTSLIPLVDSSGFTRAQWERVTPLSEVLSQAGYACVAMHANNSAFYNRSIRYEKMGFSRFFDKSDFQGRASGWYSRDVEFFSQAVDYLLEIERPFFSYLITMQSHGPFENYLPETRQQLQPYLQEASRLEANYLYTFREIDQALENLFRKLAENQLLENTLILLYGDHASGVQDKSLAPGERVPLLVIHPHIPASKETHLVSHLNIAPTVTDALGLQSAPSWLGQSVFHSDEDEAIVVLPNGKVICKQQPTAENTKTGARYVNYSRAMLGD